MLRLNPRRSHDRDYPILANFAPEPFCSPPCGSAERGMPTLARARRNQRSKLSRDLGHLPVDHVIIEATVAE
jgi:hypothetical protein